MVIIGTYGFQGSGKDTFANYLVKNYNFIKFSFASATKDVLNILFGWDRNMLEGETKESREFRETVDEWWSEKLGIPNLTPRIALQLIGTKVFRENFNPEIWVKIIEKKILNQLKLNPESNIIISDCRFPNEIGMLKNLGCIIIHIQINISEVFGLYKSGCKSEEAIKLHESETSWIGEKFDYTIDNFQTKEKFELSIDEFINENFNVKYTKKFFCK